MKLRSNLPKQLNLTITFWKLSHSLSEPITYTTLIGTLFILGVGIDDQHQIPEFEAAHILLPQVILEHHPDGWIVDVDSECEGEINQYLEKEYMSSV